MDKQEIIDQARKIGTFETSAVPDQDCWQLFVPRYPATKARLANVEEAESNTNVFNCVTFLSPRPKLFCPSPFRLPSRERVRVRVE